MKNITLTAEAFFHWLSQKDTIVRDDLWHFLVAECTDNSSYEHKFIVNQVTYPWSVEISALFINSRKLKLAGWISTDDELLNDNVLFIKTIIMSLTPGRIAPQKTSKYITPLLTYPEIGIRIETPSLIELDSAWNSLAKVAPTIHLMAEKLSLDLKFELAQSLGL